MASEMKPAMWQPNLDMAAWPANPQQMVETPRPNNVIDDPLFPVVQDIEKVRQQTLALDELAKQIEQDLASVIYQIQELRKSDPHLQHGNSMEWVQVAQQECTRNAALLQERITDLNNIIAQMVHIERILLGEHIAEWHRAQQLAANGLSIENRLERIQDVCEITVEVIWQNLELAQRLNHAASKVLGMSPELKDAFATHETRIRELLSAFITGTFIVEKQPPQVMKTNTRFSTTIRMLIGGRLNIYLTPPHVRVSIISEAQACALTGNEGFPTADASGEILNSSGNMEYNANSKLLSISFRNMSLRKIKRAEKKGTESVMDEKFCLLFQAVVKVGNMSFAVRTQSLPVVVIVHGNQEPDAWATVTWDNAFSVPRRLPFVVPEAVPWSGLARVLSMKFRSATGRELSESNLHLLATKAFRDPSLPLDCGARKISWALFCKELLPDRTFSFWEWFYAVMKVTREHLRALWNDGAIMGFIGRHETEAILKKKPDGTFLLRFSDSELGGVSIAWVYECDGQKNVLMVHPFTARDFQIRSLADRISDLTTLLYLYPDIPRDQAFVKYYTPSNILVAPQSGYIKSTLVNQLLQASPSYSNPPTPQPFYGHSETGMYPSSHDGSSADQNLQMFALNGGESMKRRRSDEPHQQNWQQGTSP